MAYQGKNTCNFEKMNVKDIRYTQHSIRDTFTDGTPLNYTIDMLKTGKIKPKDISPIRVGKYNGYYRTIDNRRLYCFKQSNIKKITVKYIHNIGNLPDFRDKYTSNNGGTFIKIRKEHVETFFYCDVCDANMTLPDKMSHLNGRRHHKNLKNQNADNSIKNKSENDKLVSVSQNIKALGSNANNKGIYDVKVRIEPVISYKPKTNNVLRSRELQLEQQVNAYKIKFDLMQQQIHNY
eukprot:39530_1